MRDRLRQRPAEAPWWNWLMFGAGAGEAVGSVAFAGPPDEQGAVLIGYAMYAQFEGHGYATEAVRAMIGVGVRAARRAAGAHARAGVEHAGAPGGRERGMRPVAADEDDDVGEVLLYAVTAPASVGSA